jgi:hypothetical protein
LAVKIPFQQVVPIIFKGSLFLFLNKKLHFDLIPVSGGNTNHIAPF